MKILQENKDLQPVDVDDEQPENLMFIESVEHQDLMRTLYLYIFIIILSLFVGMFIQSSKEFHRSNCFVIDEEASFSFSLMPLNIFNQYLYSDFTIKLSDTSKKQLAHSQFDVYLKAYKSNQLIKNKTYSNSIYPIFPTRKSVSSAPQRFYFDNDIYFDSIVFKINFHNLSDNIELISIQTVNGRKSSFIFNFLIRSFFAIFQTIFLLTTHQKLKSESYRHKEQKLTFALTTLCLLSDIPLWMFYQYFRFFETLFTSAFHSFLKIYPISILAILREPYMVKQTNSQITQIFFFFFLFLSEIMHQNNSDISLLRITTPVSSQAGAIISFELGINLIYITWLIVSIISTSTKIKGADFFRNMYFCYMIGVSLITYIISNCLWKIRDISKSSVSEFVGFFISNVFVLIATYAHWPYNTKKEVFYTEVKEGSADLLDPEQDYNK